MKYFSMLLIIFSFSSLTARSDIEKAGDHLRYILPLSGAAMASYHSEWDVLLDYTKAFTTTMVCTSVLKELVNERRPNGNKYSFPSGHTSAAFAGAAFLQVRYGWMYGLPAYSLASYVGFSRVYAKKHYPHDVVAAAFLAIIVNYYLVDSPVNISASYLEEQVGIKVSVPFK